MDGRLAAAPRRIGAVGYRVGERQYGSLTRISAGARAGVSVQRDRQFPIARSGLPPWDDFLGELPAFYLLLRRDNQTIEGLAESVELARRACRAASDTCEAAGWGQVPWGTPQPTPLGPLIHVGAGILDMDELDVWFDHLEVELAGLAWHGHGTLQGLSSHQGWFTDVEPTVSPWALAGFHLDSPQLVEPRHELNPYSLPLAIPEMAELVAAWVGQVSPISGLNLGYTRVDYRGGEMAAYLEFMLRASQTLIVSGLEPGPAFRECLVWRTGSLVFRGCDPDDNWQNRVQRLTELLVTQGAQLDVGLIGHISKPWGLPNRHLWARWIPSPAGVMLLNDYHVQKLPPLPDWTRTQISAHRWLVQARDLEPWYARPAPDPETLAAARAELAPALATPAINTRDQDYPAIV